MLRRILCVDDEPDIRKVLVAALRYGTKAEVTAVGSAEEAFRLLAEGDLPDVILLDGVMPGMDGWETCRRLREDPRLTAVPIVFLTGGAESSERALACGAIGCLSKPFDPMTLGAELQRVLASAG